MKKCNLLLLILISIIIASCKKREAEPSSNPTLPTSNCKVTQIDEKNNIIYFYYDSLNRIDSTVDCNKSKGDTTITNYQYTNKKITCIESNGIKFKVYTYYLNDHGFADSLVVNTDSLMGSHSEKYSYNKDFQIINREIIGENIFGKFDLEIIYEYINGNVSKQTEIDHITSTTGSNIFEYYLDKSNTLKTLYEKKYHYNFNTNLLKKIPRSPESFDIFTYNFDSYGNVIQMKISNERNQEILNTNYKWDCK